MPDVGSARGQGTCPFACTHTQKRWIFGAVRLRDEKFFYAREEEKFNAQSCWQFLKQLHHKSIRSAKRVVIILDNAKYGHALLHKASARLPSEITLFSGTGASFLLASSGEFAGFFFDY